MCNHLYIDIMPNSLTIFDLDDTLLNGDTMVLWHHFLVEQRLIDDPDTFLAQDAEFDQLYRSGKLDMQKYLHFSLAPLQNLSAQEVDQLVSRFIDEKVKSRLYEQAKHLVAELREKHHHLLVISATVDFIVRPVAKLFGIQDVLAINVSRQQGCYTSNMIGTPSFQEGKVVRLHQWLTNQNWDPDILRFYSDSVNDLPLLEQVDEAHVVNPKGPLLDIAQRRKWPVHHWRRVNADA